MINVWKKIVVKRLIYVLDGNAVVRAIAPKFDDKQFAYLRNRSSTQAVLSLAENVKRNIQNRKLTGVVFFDFADAFGRVDRTKLLLKLCQDFGISGSLLNMGHQPEPYMEQFCL